MNVITRGIRNAFRNSIRTFSVVVILALSVGLALSMLVARQAVDAKIQSVKSSIGNTITVSPAGARGFEGGGEPLTADELSKVKTTAHVIGVDETLEDRLDSSSTNLQSAIDPGTLGRRAFRFNRGGDGGTTMMQLPANFSLPISVTGTDTPTSLAAAGGGDFTVKSGSPFMAGSTDNVAMLGTDLATKNNLSVGSTFQAYGQTIKVVAIFDGGNKFANSQLMMPLATVQKLSNQTGDISAATVRVDSIDNLSSTTSAIKAELGDVADVANSQDTSSQALAPLESIVNVSTFSLFGAVAAGASIVLLTMVMIVRERRREIGVLKAIGASDMRVMVQFMTESVTFTLLGAVGGVLIAVLAAAPLAHFLVTTSTSTTADIGHSFAAGRAIGSITGGGGMLNIADVSVRIGWDVLAYGLLAALVIAVVGSVAASWLISKIRPAEVMRAE